MCDFSEVDLMTSEKSHICRKDHSLRFYDFGEVAHYGLVMQNSG